MGEACDLMGPVSIAIQALLGLLLMSSLVIKRYREYPTRRPWKVWFYDVSKQVFGALGVHVLNLVMSIISGKDLFGMLSFVVSLVVRRDAVSVLDKKDELNDPCNYYFLNILFDTTIGVPILWGSLIVVYRVMRYWHVEGIESGEYGNPPKFVNYVKQLLVYIVGLVMMKIIVYVALICFPILLKLADWILSVFDKNDDLQLVFVLMVFPLVMNTVQYYLIDNIIQSPEYKTHLCDEDKGLLGQPLPDEDRVQYNAI